MDDTPLLRRYLGIGTAGPRYQRRRIGIANLAATTVQGRERVFLLDRFLGNSSRSYLAGKENDPTSILADGRSTGFSIESSCNRNTSANWEIHYNTERTNPQKSALLTCPPPILHAIFEYLPWSALELLSRTCSMLWNQLHPLCRAAISDMCQEEHIQHQTKLAQAMPLHVVCADCGRLHHADYGDVPAVCSRSACVPCPGKLENYPRSPDLAYGYQLEYHHVQLALKLRRLGLLGDYANSILQPYYARSSTHDTFTMIQLFVCPILTLHEPKPSFLVFRTMEFFEHVGEHAEPLGADTIQSLVVCPHACLTDGDPEDIRCDVLYNAIEDARLGLSSRRDFACRRCPTDVSIDAQPSRLRVRIWHDLGKEGISPMDVAWRVHIGGPGNNEFVGPSVSHVNGSIRARYEHAVHLQPPNKAVTICENQDLGLTSLKLLQAGWENLQNRVQGYEHMCKASLG